MELPVWLVATAAGLFGACVGSFLNVCIYRIPNEGLKVYRPAGSFCPKCNKPIAGYDNIPVLSWLLLRGRCRQCKAKISARYPFVEALTAALFVLVVLEPQPAVFFDGAWLFQAISWALFLSILVVISFIDIDLQIIPDELSVTPQAFVPFVAFLVPEFPIHKSLPGWIDLGLSSIARGTQPFSVGLLGFGAVVGGALTWALYRRFVPTWDGKKRSWWESRLAGGVGAGLGLYFTGLVFVVDWMGDARAIGLGASLFGMAVGAGSIYSIGVLGKLMFRKDAMGFGDVKLMGLLGAVLGWQPVLLSIFIACLLGSVIGITMRLRSGSQHIPFGPFLCAGAISLVFWGDHVDRGLEWYQSLFTR